MNTLALTFLCAIASLIAVFESALAQGAATDVAEIRHGEYIATASDCEACHTAPGGKRLAGGLPIESPLGTIYSTNITPSKQHGLGNYSLQQFSDALRRGIRGDGAVGGTSSDSALPGGPAQLFAANCTSCHGIGAKGSPDNYFPSLFHNSALAAGGGRNLVAAILFGIDRTTSDGLAFMPGFGGKPTDIAALNNEEVAQLTNYLLQHYGDAAHAVTPQLVQDVRSGQAPKPLLATLVDVGEWAAGAFLILLVTWLIGRRYARHSHVHLPHFGNKP